MVAWSLRVGLISCLSSPEEILVTLLPPSPLLLPGNYPTKYSLLLYASSFSANMLKRTTNILGSPSEKKTELCGKHSQTDPNPLLDVYLPSYFWHAEMILRC